MIFNAAAKITVLFVGFMVPAVTVQFLAVLIVPVRSSVPDDLFIFTIQSSGCN